MSSHDKSTAIRDLIPHTDPGSNFDLAQAAEELHDITGTWDLTQAPGVYIQTALARADRGVPWEYRRDIHYVAVVEDRAPEAAELLDQLRADQEALTAAQAEVLAASERRAARVRLLHRHHGVTVRQLVDVLGVDRQVVYRLLRD